MNVRLQATKGPLRGHSFVVKPDERCVIGRDTGATISTMDVELSREHCELVWDDRSLRVSDLGSKSGTIVNGERVRDAILRHGDELKAGRSVFLVEIPGALPRSADAPSSPRAPRTATQVAPAAADSAPGGYGKDPLPPSKPEEPIAPTPLSSEVAHDTGPSTGPVPSQAVPAARTNGPLEIFTSAETTLARARSSETVAESLLAHLEDGLQLSRATHLYALVDGAQDVELAFTARLMGHRLFTLFEGDMAEHLAHVGPCLVALEWKRGERLAYLEAWVDTIGKNAGVLLQTSADLRTLARHLREIFVVTDEEGQEYFFRYYDPRVLRAFLPTCRAEEIREFFGPIDRWIAESGDGKGYRIYSIAGDAYEEEDIGKLAPSVAASSTPGSLTSGGRAPDPNERP